MVTLHAKLCMFKMHFYLHKSLTMSWDFRLGGETFVFTKYQSFHWSYFVELWDVGTSFT